MLYLRQATSAQVNLGPYTGSDGVALIALSVNRAQIQLSKNGDTFAQKNNTGNGSHQIIGMYSAMFDDTDTGSLGRLLCVSSVGTALPVWHEYTVLPTSVFDALVLGSDLLQADLGQWRGTQPSALIAGRVDANAQVIGDSVITSAAYAQNAVDRLANSVSGLVDVGLWRGVQPNNLISNRVDVSAGAIQNVVVTSAAMDDSAVGKMANMLARDMSSIGATIAARSPVNALRIMRNRLTTSGFLTVYAEDDATAVWTAALTLNASAQPIVESDPA